VTCTRIEQVGIVTNLIASLAGDGLCQREPREDAEECGDHQRCEGITLEMASHRASTSLLGPYWASENGLHGLQRTSLGFRYRLSW